MKSPGRSNDSPHENTTAADKKPLRENEERSNIVYSGSLSPSSSLPVMLEDPYAHSHSSHRVEYASPSWSQPPFNMHHHQQQQFVTPFYTQGTIYSNHMHNAFAAYYPPVIHTPPVMPPNMGGTHMGLSYFGHRQSCPNLQSSPPPNATYAAAPVESRGTGPPTLVSPDAPGTSARRTPRHGKRNGRRGNGPRQHTVGGGSPPGRGWCRHDDSATLYQVRGRILEIAKDRDGSKFIQRRLQAADVDEMKIAFEEALDGIDELLNDVYGNYILQGLLELGAKEMRDRIGQKIVDSGVVTLSTKIYGCRLIQKALDTLDKEDVANIVASVKGKVWHLVQDHNGNHVIQKSVTKINEFFHQSQGREETAEDALLSTSLDIIVDEVTASMADLSIHPYGCRVVQRLIECCSGARRARVLDGVMRGGLHGTLIDHEYGNYVVQRVLAYGRTSDRVAVFDVVSRDVLGLSRRKHSSNVVELMLKHGDAAHRRRIIEEIANGYCVDQKFNSKSAAVSMAQDAYANYVMKTVLDILEEGPTREKLFGTLLSNLGELEMSPFAKQVVLRVKAYAKESNYE